MTTRGLQDVLPLDVSLSELDPLLWASIVNALYHNTSTRTGLQYIARTVHRRSNNWHMTRKPHCSSSSSLWPTFLYFPLPPLVFSSLFPRFTILLIQPPTPSLSLSLSFASMAFPF